MIPTVTFDEFVKNSDLLKEDYRHSAGFAKFNHPDIARRIDELDRTCVLALVGPYGSGKSTALHRVKDRLDDTTWLQFDAWRYPERKALWDGLIIETAKQLGSIKKAARALDGNEAAIGKWGGITTSIFASVSDLMPKGAFEWIGDKIHKTIPDLTDKETKEIKEAGPIADKMVKNLFGRSAAKRAYEFEKVLTDLLVSVKTSRIIIVVEDVDRSGSDGLHFLETLSFYLGNTKALKEKRVIAVAPISDTSYREHEDMYLKCVDYIELFRPGKPNLDDFIQEVFFDMEMHPEKTTGIAQAQLSLRAFQAKYFMESLFYSFPNEMNMRKLKLILREASAAYRLMQMDGLQPDWLIVLCIQAMKHVHDSQAQVAGQKAPTHFDKITSLGEIQKDGPFSSTISAVTDGLRQKERPGSNAALVESKAYSFGEPFKIDYDFREGSLPELRPAPNDHHQNNRLFHIQGYYFQY